MCDSAGMKGNNRRLLLFFVLYSVYISLENEIRKVRFSHNFQDLHSVNGSYSIIREFLIR